MLHKTLSLSDAAVKFSDDGAATFSGYASVFGGVDSYGDTIIRGAYDYTLRTHGKPKMFVNHDSMGLPIGKWAVVKEDDHGLLVQGEFTPGMARADETRAALKHGTVDGLSIGYLLKKGDYEEMEDGKRMIKRVSRLFEVSVVTFPADEAARVDLGSVKSDEIEGIETVRDFEYFLRDAGGLSKGLAQALVGRARVLFGTGEPGLSGTQAKAAQEVQAILDRMQSTLQVRLIP
ncbi:MAG: HK97 family phage prohead protease [Pseudomonadota bacterium]|jgi:HK97 family phage prohead protease